MSAPFPVPYPAAGLPEAVTVYEVGPRDGLQAEKQLVSTSAKIDFITALRQAGLPMVEATSFVSPRWVPQLADAADVLAGLGGDLSAHPVLVPNLTGLERASEAGASTIAVFVSATESFAQQNLNTTRAGAIGAAQEVTARARERGMRVRAYVSMCFGDTWQGQVPVAEVAHISRELLDAGCYEVSLGDTIGVGTAGHVDALIQAHQRLDIAVERLALHLHDTYGQALANVYAGLRAGVRCFDASAGGIGGCPFAGSATGNLATEDLLWLLAGLQIRTGVDLDAVVRAGAVMTDALGRPRSRIAAAMLG
ncbi:hydroxymethylglutaryl-CoA lyase [Mycolicibacterium smegmatis]|uniref:hydroxymethylglutaryl-CoA lyase n=1 Tax=Mycolicibacterium smegmatis TaxID=1772 RepID=UPI001E33E68F|nr:hydroxymethylglutaryl-CoA lyase [Mycolicibacterium smegmatis]UGU34416.1 hydroxymethylglutaryl-CoA lyase [Mycolicibacterium smegmatis]ULN69245.1 hydroxymethylglutaryl-CoA lyase [Mycolicibacterium smegmatis]